MVADAFGVSVATLHALLKEYQPANGGPGRGGQRGPSAAAIAAQFGLSTAAFQAAMDSAKAEYNLTPGTRPTAEQCAAFQADVAKTLGITTASVTAAFDAVKAAHDAERAARATVGVKRRERIETLAPTCTGRSRKDTAEVAPPRSGSGRGKSVEHVLEQLIATVQGLTETVKAQDAEARELRGRLDGVKSLLG